MSDTIRRIRIVKTPRGDAPQWVRDQWIGLELPDLGPPQNHMSYGLITGTLRRHDHGCCVPMKVALDALTAKCPEAAKWFINKLGPARIEESNFVFDEEACQPIATPQLPDTDAPIQDI